MNEQLKQLLKTTPAYIKKLEKAELDTVRSLLYFFPRKYKVFGYGLNTNVRNSLASGNLPSFNAILSGFIKNIKDEQKYTMINFQTADGYIKIFWFNRPYIARQLNRWLGKTIHIQGTVTYSPDYHSFSITNPDIISDNFNDIRPVLPVYSEVLKINGETMGRFIETVLRNTGNIPEIIPEKIREKYQLVQRKIAFQLIHYPVSEHDIMTAQSYFLVENLYTYASEMQEYYKDFTDNTEIKIHNTETTQEIISSLPFSLTNSQKKITDECIERMKNKKRLQMLVQGDVSCGKTLIAQILMLVAAENGYQGVLIAPTTVLAEQHYSKLAALCENRDMFHCVLLTGDMKASEKKGVLKKIKDGSANLIVGTTSLLSESVEFYRPGIVITDEEHRFGVQQKEELKKKGKDGVHVMNMSATPIPRSLAQVMFAGHVDVETVTDMPPGRVPVKTFVKGHEEAVEKIKEEISKGYKIYVICPQIEENDKTSKADVESTKQFYAAHFGENVADVTGRMKAKEIQEKIKEFRDGKYSVLVSTTVVEVGVDVPDATLIIIEDADMFGLSQLHQLRGRVGRSNIESFCYLIPSMNISESGKERLEILCRTNDGMKIAEEDAKMRGLGNIVGNEQSGQDPRFLMAEKYPNTFREIYEYVGEPD